MTRVQITGLPAASIHALVIRVRPRAEANLPTDEPRLPVREAG